ncbi:hypothetical protein BOO69_04275 [Sulfitobacter alexandrii]|uniref:SPOR domain-containing protein n=1 Tax=Sulfitobacter alexandrii TaxID=1917485 RepID=A0A1J0WLX7_9RHOB|nr:hypothetical protein BOO69_04275 [Sulfitobacter alexandrii]
MAASGGTFADRAVAQEQVPAEFPPASYKGKQYIDSQGCVFIRAGIDGNVTWIPRVTRSRKVVCGFKPTLAGQVASAAPAPSDAPAPVQITLNDAPVATPVPAPAPRRAAPPKPAPVVVRQTAPAPKPRPRVTPEPVVIAPAPVAPVQTATRVAGACPGASALSSQYLRGAPGVVVRCGPQAERIVASGGASRRGAVAVAADDIEITAHTRIVPKHVAQNRINTIDGVRVPKGYKEVWDDGRLNPHRAEQTLAGRSDMLLIWTQTVPRRLIDRRTGRDMTASVPLVYPYLDIVTQRRQLGEVTIVQRDGKLAKRIIRNAGTAKRKPVYSSRSAPQAAQPQASAKAPALAGKRFVQIGTYGNPANARRAAQTVARIGMAARIGKHNRGGTTYMTVQAGPFQSASALRNAVQQLRGAGYRDAFAR